MSEVTSFGSRSARELSRTAKGALKAMHKESLPAKLGKQLQKQLQSAVCSCKWRKMDDVDFSFAPLLIILLYVLGGVTLLAAVVVFMVALLQGFQETLPTWGTASLAPPSLPMTPSGLTLGAAAPADSRSC